MSAFSQQQFLTVLDRDEAERRFREHLQLQALPTEVVPLSECLGRVLAADFSAPSDVPGFDRSNVDGFALQAEQTFGASEDNPLSLAVIGEALAPGRVPAEAVRPGTAMAVATGAMLPRGANAIAMIEHTTFTDGVVSLTRPAVPGANITWAGTDIGRSETVLPRGTLLTSRETGVIAALGLSEVAVVRRPRVGLLSTGDELQTPGEAPRVGCVFDSNQTVLADAVRELGGEPIRFGIVPDDLDQLRLRFAEALRTCDAVLLSGGTSKGAGDVSYRVIDEFGPPGIVAHGVALKPGKPLCLGVCSGKPVAVLPGFPTSAVFTFQDFVAPVLRILAGRLPDEAQTIRASISQRINSERGRTEYVLVGLSEGVAIPLGKGSGSVTAFGRADGFISIPRHREYLDAGEEVTVTLLSAGLRPADLTVIGSHCLGLDVLLNELRERGFTAKVFAVGSTAGLDSAKRNECDLAGIHLLDANTNVYNRPFLQAGLTLLPGYTRLQGIVHRPDDQRFAGKTATEAVLAALSDPTCVLANRNRGSGTRIVMDRLLGGSRPSGFLSEAKSHSAVVAAVAQGRADWGLAIAPAAQPAGLGFLPVQVEQYDFVVPTNRLERPAVRAFVEVLENPAVRAKLNELGFADAAKG